MKNRAKYARSLLLQDAVALIHHVCTGTLRLLACRGRQSASALILGQDTGLLVLKMRQNQLLSYPVNRNLLIVQTRDSKEVFL